MRGNKILIVGAGAVGGYFGAHLCRFGHDVTFLVRPQTLLTIAKDGLSVISPLGNFTVHPPLIQIASQINSADLIILAVKCTNLQETLDAIAPLVQSGAIVLTLQNGVDSEERILSYFNNQSCVISGVAYITARLAAPGQIEHYRRGTITIGEISCEKTDRVQKIHAWISQAGIPCHLTDTIQKEKWEKLCWNATFNPLSVILKHPLSFILRSEHLLEIVREGITEIIAIASAEGFTLDPEIIEKTISVTHSLKDYYTSMYEDYKNKKPTEIEHINGDIIRRGEKYGIATPINKTLYSLVKGIEYKQSADIELLC